MLHIEDSESDQELFQFLLDGLGLLITSVGTGKEAIAAVNKESFDVVISDVWLPDMTGPVIAEALRKNGYKGPIVALTADERDQVRQIALQRGCTDVLTKPFDRSKILNVLAQSVLGQNETDAETEPGVDLTGRPVQLLKSRFLERIEQQVKNMEALIREEDFATIHKLGREICASASGYGYDAIAESAKTLEQMASDKRGGPDMLGILKNLTQRYAMATRALHHGHGTAS